MHLFETPVPATAAGPVCVDAILGSVRLVSDDVLEVRRYGDGPLRVGLVLVALVLIGITVILPWWDGWLDLRIPPVLLDQEGYFGAQYDAAKAVDSFLVTGDRDSYIAERRFGAFFWQQLLSFGFVRGLPVLLLALSVFWPRPAPLRVDRAQQIVYTKRWGRLLALPIRGGSVDLEAGLLPGLSFQKSTAWGPLLLSLRPLNGSAVKRLTFGAFPAAHPGQNLQIHHAIRSFAGSRVLPDWCAELSERQTTHKTSPFRLWLSGLTFRVRFTATNVDRLAHWRQSIGPEPRP